jgi:hypothetical protein
MAALWLDTKRKAPMSLEEAHKLLDRVREGHNAPVYLITIALILTGDLPHA